jgi:hypothetical protein
MKFLITKKLLCHLMIKILLTQEIYKSLWMLIKNEPEKTWIQYPNAIFKKSEEIYKYIVFVIIKKKIDIQNIV